MLTIPGIVAPEPQPVEAQPEPAPAEPQVAIERWPQTTPLKLEPPSADLIERWPSQGSAELEPPAPELIERWPQAAGDSPTIPPLTPPASASAAAPAAPPARRTRTADAPTPAPERSTEEHVVVEIPANPELHEGIEPEIPLKKVLIVDDNSDYRDALRLLLVYKGYEVYTAENGRAGMELALEARPDLVITDFNMPGMNGYEMVVELRSRPDTTTIPIVLFTGASNRRQLEGLEVNDCRRLEKPFSNEMLLSVVGETIGSGSPFMHKSQRQAEEIAKNREEVAKRVEERLEVLAANPEELKILAQETPQQQKADETLLDDSDDDRTLIGHINRILVTAVDLGASDIHFEPGLKEIAVRFRVDGCLRRITVLPAALSRRLAARLKIMASLVITERRLPQDGQIKAQIKGRRVEFRMSSLPSQHGEKIVLRVLGGCGVKDKLSDLGLSPRGLQAVERALTSTHGLILVTGPTGSGKSTTLYTMVNVLNSPDINIMTAEDPVEHEIAGVTQVAAKPAIGLTFESILRAFMRQDPDVMLVGEIRDLETANIAVKASITGHLVLSTLHTNSAAGTIVRLTNMGVPPYLVAASVKLVVAQRLVRRVCDRCRAPAEISEQDRRLLTEVEAAIIKQPFAGKGCEDCHQTGYSGRIPLFEVLPISTPEMRNMIQQGASTLEIELLARREAMTTLREAAIEAVGAGITSMAEAAGLIAADG